MNYIIDGFNLAFKIENIANTISQGALEKAISQIIYFVRSVLSKKNIRIIMVFDGQNINLPLQKKQSGIEIIFSKKPQTADDIIRNFVRHLNNKNKWTVVSSDNEIMYTAQDHGVKALSAEDFLKLKKSFPKKDTLRSIEIKRNPENIDMDYWRAIFNDGKKDEQ